MGLKGDKQVLQKYSAAVRVFMEKICDKTSRSGGENKLFFGLKYFKLIYAIKLRFQEIDYRRIRGVNE